MRRPLLALGAFVALGALLGADATAVGSAWLIGLTACLLALALAGRRLGAVALALAGGALALGAAASAVEEAAYDAAPLRAWMDSRPPDESAVRIEGVAAADGRDAAGRLVLILDITRITDDGRALALTGRVRVGVFGQAPHPEIIEGDRVALWAQLRPPRGFANPGVRDAARAARHLGIHAVGYCKSSRLLNTNGRADIGWLRDSAARARASARRVLRAFLPAGPEEALVRAMVLGDRTGIDEDTADAFRIAGTYHVLAISGAQVALLAGIVLWGLSALSVRPVPRAVVVTASVAFYALFVGGDVPVVRAALMVATAVLGRALELDADLANLLGLAAGVLLVLRPSDVADVGFQLSFGATLGLLLVGPLVASRLPRLPLRADLALAASFAAQLALAPLLILHFHRLAPAALLLNLVAVPLASIVLLAGLLVLAAASLVPAGAWLFADIAWLAAHALLRSSAVVRVFPGLDFRLPTPSAAALAVYALGLALLVSEGRRRAGVALTGLALLGLLAGRGVSPGDGCLRMTVLDVGQGDCLVVRSPEGRTWVVDAAGSYDGGFDFGEEVVGPYLWSEGIRKIDVLLLTHAHPDHVGAAPLLLNGFGIGEVWEGVAPRADRVYAGLEERLQRSSALRRTVFGGVFGRWDDVTVEVLGPRPTGPPPAVTRNDDSVVVALGLGSVRFLLTGDVESKGEQRLGEVRAGVVKVPHHGSRTSSSPSFLAAAEPRLALISVGFRSRFGHPHKEVLSRLARSGARVYRTDLDGAITVSTDGTRIWIRTYRGGSEERIQ